MGQLAIMRDAVDPLAHYSRMDELVTSLCAEHPIDSVLEIGCGSGDYVKSLRERGFDAFGVDINRSFSDEYLIHADAGDMESMMGGKRLDMVIANGVMCRQAQLNRFRDKYGPMVYHSLMNHEDGKKMVETMLKGWASEIMHSAYSRTREGGLFVCCEYIAKKDSIILSEEEIKRTDYDIISLEPREMILQK
ncbi:MAG: methyltransferase domain-containing protein [Candidatus Woesearchaeota archaeon]